ncbi:MULTISPECIES: sensor histidine kinase [Cyanophyceae]|jgi:hypothetical protein|uniref:sensor histidine kinase n=1 Tax=Cyanophyceae TaxID=3028117 RepID=UPI001689A2A5|nr:HAMP domain-containing sensor histidine kinase [Trichocoleus sp. FACHB-69]MBD1932387.1 HAMP domain-containing histidine kinase [Trichocoleus sp. FACHB-69]
MPLNKVGLRSRLFLSHLLVMMVGVGSLLAISKLSSPRFFIVQLQQIEISGVQVRYARRQLVRSFETAWSRSTLLSVLVGATAAGGLSYLVTRRIVQPLKQMEQITQKFAAGHLDERLPNSEIRELNRLAASFNRMASSLEGVEQRRRELISDLTHELRTPLTVIRGYLEEMADGGIEPSPEVYQQLVRETTRLERLVNDLQELSKAEAGYLPINLQPVNLRPLLESLVERFSEQLLEDGPVALKLDCPPQLPPVLADIDRVEQVLVNLLGNALLYTSFGSITVRVWSASQRLWIAVVDTGKGIAPEDLPHVFERFWRADESRQNSRGTGIGLAISSRLIELQGGQIEVESKLGMGSTFRFFLPLA